jgi:hypothetical protein
MSKISRTVRGGEEVARNVCKGCRTLEEEDFSVCLLSSLTGLTIIFWEHFCNIQSLYWLIKATVWSVRNSEVQMHTYDFTCHYMSSLWKGSWGFADRDSGLWVRFPNEFLFQHYLDKIKVGNFMWQKITAWLMATGNTGFCQLHRIAMMKCLCRTCKQANTVCEIELRGTASVTPGTKITAGSIVHPWSCYCPSKCPDCIGPSSTLICPV